MVYINYEGPRRITKARELGRTQTNAESILWNKVRNLELGGFKIRRQQIINEIIVDFYCPEKRLCIEIDGPYHLEPIVKGLDNQRDEELECHGFFVLRFTNDEVIFNIEEVLVVICATLQKLPSNHRSTLNHDKNYSDSPIPIDPNKR
jgi:very-short-patch-repair endonuclease